MMLRRLGVSLSGKFIINLIPKFINQCHQSAIRVGLGLE
jgi:hypothetical protein